MENLKKILIKENHISISADLSFIDKNILPHCPAIQKAFENLELAYLSDIYLNDILFNSSSKIESELTDQIFNGKQELLADTTVDSALMAIAKLRQNAEILINKCSSHNRQDLLNYLSISENKNIVFSADSKEKLKESYRTYLISEKGIRRRKLHEDAAKSLNLFKKSFGGELSSNVDVLEMFDYDINNDDIFPVICDYE